MTVKELIDELQQYNPNLPVMVSSDSEGNHINPACEVWRDQFDGDSIIAEEDYESYEEGDLEEVVVIWP